MKATHRWQLLALSALFLAGTVANIACDRLTTGRSYATNCGDVYWENMKRVEDGVYAVEVTEIDPELRGDLFGGSSTVEVQTRRKPEAPQRALDRVSFRYEIDGNVYIEHWRAED
jgi:hypothetical protein